MAMRPASGAGPQRSCAACRHHVTPPGPRELLALLLGCMPRVVRETVTGLVAGLLVLHPRIERLALVRPLLAAVVARDDRPVGARGRAGCRHQRRPVRRAGSVARALAARILVE